MGTRRKTDFGALVKKYAGSVAAILSLTALVLSTLQSLSSDLTFGALALLAVATLLLLAYNVWLVKRRTKSERGQSKRKRQRAQVYRWAVHSASAVVLVLSWSVAGVLASDKYASYLFLSLGQYERAAARLHSYVSTHKDDITAYKQLAEAYKELKQYNAYFLTLEELLKNKQAFDSLDPSARNHQLGLLHFEVGTYLLVEEFTEGMPSQSQRALYHIKNARLYMGDNPVLLFILGYVEADTGGTKTDSVARVKDVFRKAKVIIDAYPDVEKRPEYTAMYHSWYGRALRKLKRYDEAETELTTALELAPTVPAGPSVDRERILFELGANEYDRTNDTASANKYWRKISNEKFLRESVRLNGLALWSRGVEETNAGRHREAGELYKKAEELLTLAVRMGDRSPRLHLQLGALYFSRKDYRQAAATFESLTQMWPTKKLGFYWLARSQFLVKGRLAEADQAMSKAVEIEPDDGQARYWLGRIALARGQYDRARTELLKSLELGKYRDDLHGRLVVVNLAMAEKTPAHSDQYISHYEEALRYANEGIEKAQARKSARETQALQGIKAMIANSLAYAYAQRKLNLRLALNYIDSALAHNPNEPHYLDTKAWILILMAERATDPAVRDAELRNAETLLGRALDRMPEKDKAAKAEGLYHLGYALKLRGDRDGARTHFMEALDLNPAYAAAKAELQ